MSVDISGKFPYTQMKEKTSDGQAVVYIPAMKIKTITIPTGAKHAGTTGWMLAENGDDTHHVHPAFMNHGVAAKGIELSSYIAGKDSNGKATSLASTGSSCWTNISYNDIRAAGKTRNTGTAGTEQYGWHAWNIYEHHLLALLMLIEYGTTDMQAKLGTDNVNYRGIRDPWGAPHLSKHFWIDGLLSDSSNNIQIFDNLGNETMVSTGKAFAGSGWMKESWTDKGTNYNLADVFLQKTTDNTEGNGSFSDYVNSSGGCAFYANCGSGSGYGPFYRDCNSPSLSDSNLGFRLARYVM